MRFSEMATVESSREETASPKMILRRKSSDQSLKVKTIIKYNITSDSSPF